jgi:hypothetical protein
LYSLNSSFSGALKDGGASGGLSGSDVRVISEALNAADVAGIGETHSPIFLYVLLVQ